MTDKFKIRIQVFATLVLFAFINFLLAMLSIFSISRASQWWKDSTQSLSVILSELPNEEEIKAAFEDDDLEW